MKISNFDPIEKVWSGPTQDSIYNENLSVGQLILEVLKLTPERITQIFADNGSEMSCYEMRSRTIKIAHYLMQKGYKQHDIVGIMCANSENLAPIVIACLTLGMPINTLATVMIESDIIQMYSKTKPKLIFCDVDVVEKMKKSTENMNLNAEIITLRERCEGFLFVDDLLQCDLDPQNFK
jgi:4-coumarate--CoA ligase